MLNAKAFANAVTAITVVFYLLCWLLSALVPDFIVGLAQALAHTINLEGVRAVAGVSPAMALWGLVSMAVLTWLLTYVTIWLYNRWAKQ